LTLVDLEASPDVRLDLELAKVAHAFWGAPWPTPTNGGRPGRATSGPTIDLNARWFLDLVAQRAGLARLDRRRTFSDGEKESLWVLAAGVCAICGGELRRGDEDYDHILPWIQGGPTSVENGRAVHRTCNRRNAAAAKVRAA
jgi:hypothetical protein